MTAMFPTVRLKDAIKWGVPDPILFRVSPRVVRWYAKTMTWYTCGRHYEAPIDPLQLTYIKPDKVTSLVRSEVRYQFTYSDAISEVIDGDWDKHAEPISNYVLYKSFKNHFKNGTPWRDTEFYNLRRDRFAQGDNIWGCKNMEDFKNRLQTLDNLYRNIEEEGYKTQQETRCNKDNTALRKIHRYWPPELHEVTINIGRKGELILHEGRHRLIFAKLLDIKKIPFRIKVRHQNWQKYRDEIFINEEDIKNKNRNHPDILTLMDTSNRI